MEVLLFFIAMAFFLAVIFIREWADARKREKKFIQALYNGYGSICEKEYSLERYERIPSYYEKHSGEGMVDDISWNDLNMDDIFKRMNYTFSASGEEYLYYKLRKTGTTQEELLHFEEVVGYFDTHADERVKIQYLMNELGHTGKYSLYDYIDNLDYLGERSNRKHLLCNLLFIPLIALAFFRFGYGMFGIVVLVIYNIISYFKEKGEIDPYIISFAYVLRLITVCEKMLKVHVSVCNEEWENIKRHCANLKSMSRGSFIVMTANRSKTTGNPIDIVLDYLRMMFHLDLMQFNKMLDRLRRHVDDVDGLIGYVGYVETAIATAAFRKSVPEYCIPEFVCDDLNVEEAYHPLIENAVRNSISASRGVLITGSNASGKSTFLKTMAINAMLAQTIHTCCATRYAAPFYRIYSSMALRDDITGGESYYIVEIKALKRILDGAAQSGNRVLCFVDEVLRGTNTVERIAASTEILKSLSGKNIMCFAATHDIELTELLRDCFDNYHFEEEIKDGDVVFNYKLQRGKATTRNAIKLLEMLGYEKDIINKATSLAEGFMTNGVWEA